MNPLPDCILCPLGTQGRRWTVPGAGPVPSTVMLVGEAPGAEEDATAVPFVGASGRKLRESLVQLGYDPDQMYITNLVKCRPPQNRDPLQVEVDICTAHFLRLEIATVNPQVIVAVGRYALGHFLLGGAISDAHGKPRWVGGRVLLPVYHPAATLYSPQMETVFQADLAALTAALELARYGDRVVTVNDGIAPRASVVALDTETRIRDGQIVCYSTAVSGEEAWVEKR